MGGAQRPRRGAPTGPRPARRAREVRVNGDAELGGALAGCVREHDLPPAELERVVAAGRLGPLLQLAKFHRVLPFVHRDLRSVRGVDERTMQALDRVAVTQTANQMRLVTDLAGFAAAIAPLGIPWLTFKGPVAAQQLYPRPELRTYRDVDLLVPRAEFQGAIDYLQRNGFEVIDRN